MNDSVIIKGYIVASYSNELDEWEPYEDPAIVYLKKEVAEEAAARYNNEALDRINTYHAKSEADNERRFNSNEDEYQVLVEAGLRPPRPRETYNRLPAPALKEPYEVVEVPVMP